MGKVLIIDKILNVARYGGEQTLCRGQGLGDELCPLHGFGILGRETVRIDVAAFNIGY